MAQLDISDLLSDPDFVDPVSIITRTSKPNSLGENVISETCTDSVGCVQPASGKTLQRLPEALRFANVSSFWLKSQIAVQEIGKYPEIIVFRGRRYQIQMVFDWSNYGSGYCEGVCIAEKPS